MTRAQQWLDELHRLTAKRNQLAEAIREHMKAQPTFCVRGVDVLKLIETGYLTAGDHEATLLAEDQRALLEWMQHWFTPLPEERASS